MIYNEDFKKCMIEIGKIVEKAVIEEVVNFLYKNPSSLIVN